MMPDSSISNSKLTIYGDMVSGNCLKTLWTAQYCGVPFDWVNIDILKGESRTPEFMAMNPAGQVPVLQVPGVGALDQSNAILLYIAEMSGADLVPVDPFERTQMMSWLFWEQYNHESAIAVRRFRKAYLNLPDDKIDPELLDKGYAALNRMEDHLATQTYFVGEALSLADIALVAYTRVAPEGGFDLKEYPKVREWVALIETELNIDHALEAV